MWLVASLPILMGGFLALIGALPVEVLGPGGSNRQIALHWYGIGMRAPAPLALFLMPVFYLPGVWLTSALGGMFGTFLLRRRKVVQ